MPLRFVGVPGAGERTDVVFVKFLLRASAERGALYRLWVEASRFGVAVRESLFEASDELEAVEAVDGVRLGPNIVSLEDVIEFC